MLIKGLHQLNKLLLELETLVVNVLEFGLLLLGCVWDVLVDQADEALAPLKELLQVLPHRAKGFLDF